MTAHKKGIGDASLRSRSVELLAKQMVEDYIRA